MIKYFFAAFSLFLLSCLDVRDQVELQDDGQVKWSLAFDAPQDAPFRLPDWKGLPSGVHIDSLFDHSDSLARHFGVTMHIQNPAALRALDSSTLMSPIRQEMEWGTDSLGRLVFTRKVQLQRDVPGDDGSFADRMLASIYRGKSLTLSYKVSGRILEVQPIAAKIDSAQGLVQWNVPLVRLTQVALQIRVVSFHERSFALPHGRSWTIYILLGVAIFSIILLTLVRKFHV